MPALKKTAKGQPADLSSHIVSTEFDDEDTEEEVKELAQEMETVIAELPQASYSQQAKLVARLLLKVRRFIAKVCLSCLSSTIGADVCKQVCWSLQAKKYFKKCCIDAIGNNTLELLPYCKTHWGSWHGVITHLLVLKMVRRHVCLQYPSTELCYSLGCQNLPEHG